MGWEVYLALGSNLGDRLSNLAAAIAAFPPEVQPEDCSPVYETPPWGYLEQPSFLNQVIRAGTSLEPGALLQHLKATEAKLGRQPGFLYGPRQIDIDILFYGDLVYHSEELVIPHPRLHERAFVLVPLVDLAPEMRHPLLGQTVREMLARVEATGIQLFAPGGCVESDSSVRKHGKSSGGEVMTEKMKVKPLNWEPTPGIGYSVVRRPDGGMHYTFTDVSLTTLKHWRDFAAEHLLSSDRLTRNLYDLRQIEEIPEEAVDFAVEVNNDPSTRNIRLAVVVATEPVRKAIQEIADLTTPGGVEIGIFTEMEAAEAWLDRPLEFMA